MAQTYSKLNIEINQKVTDIITAVQDDTNSRYLDVQLFDNGTPINLTGQEVRIFLKKPDGTNIWNDGEVTNATEGRCQFLLTTQTLAVCGVLETQISIWQNNEEILSTEIFQIFVTKSLRSSGSIESSNEYGSLVVLFQNIYEALDLMTEMVQSFGTAGEVAQGIPVTTFWQMLEAVYSVNAEALANASVSEVLNRMGLTTDTGGSATAGTLMAKVNELINRPISLYTVTSDNKQKDLATESQTYSRPGGRGSGNIIGLFFPEYDGSVKVKVNYTINSISSTSVGVGIIHNSNSSNDYYYSTDGFVYYYPIGTVFNTYSYGYLSFETHSSTGNYVEDMVISVRRGIPISVIIAGSNPNGQTNYSVTVNNVSLYYDIKKIEVI